MSFSVSMEGISLSRMLSFSWIALSGTTGAGARMESLEEELEEKLSPKEEEEEVFLFILKEKVNMNYLEAR